MPEMVLRATVASNVRCLLEAVIIKLRQLRSIRFHRGIVQESKAGRRVLQDEFVAFSSNEVQLKSSLLAKHVANVGVLQGDHVPVVEDIVLLVVSERDNQNGSIVLGAEGINDDGGCGTTKQCN